MKKILIADDEKNMLWALKKALKNEEYKITTASDGLEAIDIVLNNDIDLILLDLKMPKADGMEVLRKVKDKNLNIPIVMITAHGTMESAVEAMKLGAIDYISKPFNIDELKIIIKNALNIGNMQEKIELLTEELNSKSGKTIIYKSEKMKGILDIVNKVADSNATVLITGESGTGKELIANALHFGSNRNNKPYVKINCGALPENLLESELFGHERGAFTGAVSKKIGRFQLADEGTLFLDEVGELPPSIQVKLLRVLQEKEFERVGGNDTIKVDVRILAATNRNLLDMVKKGEFREDLFYRLNVIPIEIPPLRERKEEIPSLIKFFINRYSINIKKGEIKFSAEALEALVNYKWIGNIRELENFIERLVILNDGKTIKIADLPKEILNNSSESTEFAIPDEGINLDEVEKSLIVQALKKANNNRTKAAKLLGITRHTLLYRMEKYNIKESKQLVV
ncbi:sigma-54-dependent transcriptional regulator [Clostridium magnum]|nr:sigma-54 dependent transcriptional regulator [Clostridium magnum]